MAEPPAQSDNRPAEARPAASSRPREAGPRKPVKPAKSPPLTSAARRREARRQMPDRLASVWAWVAWFRHRHVVSAAVYVALFTLVGGMLAHSARTGPHHHQGELLDEARVARVGFTAVNEELTRREREAARAAVRPLYRHNGRYLDELRETLGNLPGLADRSFAELNTGLAEQMRIDAAAHAALAAWNRPEAEAAVGDAGGPDGPPASIRNWGALVDRVLAGWFRQPILSVAQWEEEEQRGRSQIRVLDPFEPAAAGAGPDERERDVFRGTLKRVDQEASLRERIVEVVRLAPEPLRPTFARVLETRVQPTYARDEAATEARRQAAHDAVEPVDDLLRPGDLIVPAGTTLGYAELRLLDAEEAAFRAQRTLGQRLFEGLGVLGITGLLGLVPWLYLFQGTSRIVRNPIRGLTFTLLMLVGQAVSILLAGVWPAGLYGSGTFGTLGVVMILAVVYDRPFAILAGTVHALLVSLSLDAGLPLLLVALTGVAAAALPLRDVRTRSKLVIVGAGAGLLMAGAALLVSAADPPAVLDEDRLTRLGLELLAPLISGFAAGLLIQGLLPVVEGVFRISTAMTLKDLNDNSRPLLQRLAREAPGTYQHSLRIADMAEAAAEAIGGDGLLARTGAMYHDIGKINKPQYFVENQGGGPNKHDKLSPAMSLLILVNHVKDGATMAREYNLPRQVVDFIETHHGTTLVEYFFHAARSAAEQKKMEARGCGGGVAAVSGGSEPKEFQYRYPGPRPRNRETAILLLCDGIEAAARSLTDPTPAQLQQLVHQMAMKRLLDGQFDHCSLTLAELSTIEQAITKTLCAIHHSRIKYPDGDRDKDRAKAATPPQDPASGETAERPALAVAS
ncbi:HDIG domain-containing metalloprotein [Phycisphaera mikurensis]|uniref:Hypothetical membrane protein n=1 Tax=Phycisphaera mikurensis (strain NBRC 102666 / KCTC 22515 / FYK2301M01) TaxID=1142394 RepID=I0IF75_PHYMF|nr:HDIG domain-containing metalloprotein [Phycisphaera mikurensis]MBB6440691.1 hypothetical protein [Phycisphaera mikurensis]BAM03913.1 hypothetical membrane protein [Phycisphaera mikurensis NBRC 102666]